jgi:hypothetical protein
MPQVRVDPSHFSSDTGTFIRLLHRRGVRYLIVGGEAVIFYGHVRLTGDVDFFFDPSPENAERLFQALTEFWDGEVPGMDSATELEEPGLVVQFGLPPNRIDLINSIEAVGFEEAWNSRVTVLLGTDDECPIHFIGLETLIRNKAALNRPKDLADLEYLRSVPENGAS